MLWRCTTYYKISTNNNNNIIIIIYDEMAAQEGITNTIIKISTSK